MCQLRSFPTEETARRFADSWRPDPVVFVGHCQTCRATGSVSVPGKWWVHADLLGTWNVHTVAKQQPAGDPCGHDRMVWQQVQVLTGSTEPCGATCRDATGSSCSCSCYGKNHAVKHRTSPNGDDDQG